MAALPKHVSKLAGTNVVLATAGVSGDTADIEVGTAVLVQNTTGSPITVTATTVGTYQGLAVANEAVVVPANGQTIIGPFTKLFENVSDHQVHLTYSGVGCKVAVLHIPTSG